MIGRYTYNVYHDASVTRSGKFDEGRLPLWKFKVGSYVGIRICYNTVFHGDDYGGSERFYTDYELFKVADVIEGKGGLLGPIKNQVILETPDHTTGILSCTIRNKRTDTWRRYTEYTWVLEEKLMAWLEKDFYITAYDTDMDIKLYETDLEVKRALQEKQEFKNKMYAKWLKDSKQKAEDDYNQKLNDALKAHQEAKAHSEVKDMFYNNAPGQDEHVIITCPRCGQKFRLPIRNKILIYTCPKCGHKGEYKHTF